MQLKCVILPNSKELDVLPLEDSYMLSERRILKASPVTLGFYDSERFVGFLEFDLRVFNKNAYITFYVIPQERGKGYGKKIVESAIEYARNEMNLHRLTAEVYEYNLPSVKIMESLNFVLEGKLREAKYHNGKYWDILVFGKILH